MKIERVEYSTIRSDYNIYKVENGQILKLKLEVIDVINEIEEDGKPTADIKTQIISPVITPNDIDTTGLEYSLEVKESDQTGELKFETLREVINIYETKKSFIISAIKLDKIFATNKKNKKNEPVLRFGSINALDVIEKPQFDLSKKNIPVVHE